MITLDTRVPKSLSLALGSTVWVPFLPRCSLHPALSVILSLYKLRFGTFLTLLFLPLLFYLLDLKQSADFKTWYFFFFKFTNGFPCRIWVIWRTEVCLLWMVDERLGGGPVVHDNFISGFRLQQHFHSLPILSVWPLYLSCFGSISLNISAEFSFFKWNMDVCKTEAMSCLFSCIQSCISSAHVCVKFALEW